DVNLVDSRSHFDDLVDYQRSKGKRNESSDLVAYFQISNVSRSDFLNGTDQHSAGTCPRILVLTCFGNDVQHGLLNFFLIFRRVLNVGRLLAVAGSSYDLCERSGVDVQSLDVDQN